MAITHERMRYNVGQLDSFGLPDNQKTVVLSPTLDAVTKYVTYVGGETTSTFSHTIDGNFSRCLLVATAYRSSGYATGVTYNATSMTCCITDNLQGDIAIQIWYLLETNLPASGAHNVVVTTAVAQDMAFIASSWDNVGSIGECVKDYYTRVSSTIKFKPVPGDVCVSFFATLGQTDPLFANSPSTMVIDANGVTGNLSVAECSLLTGTNTEAITWGYPSTPNVHVGLMLKQYANPAPPPILLDNITYGTTSGANDVSWTHTVGTEFGNRALFLFVSYGVGGNDTITATYNGAAMTQLDTRVTGGTYSYIFYKKNPSTGANTVDFQTVGASDMWGSYWCVSMFGVNQTTAATGSGSTGASDPITTTITLGADEMLWGVVGGWNNSGNNYIADVANQEIVSPYSTSWWGGQSPDGSWKQACTYRRCVYTTGGWGTGGDVTLKWANAGGITLAYSFARIYPA